MPDASSTLVRALIDGMRKAGRLAHEAVISALDDLNDAQIGWRSGERSPSIGFHVWHLARWADFDTHQFSGDPEIWTSQDLAAAWGFPASLGENDTGTELSDEMATVLVLPAREALLEYTRHAFDAVDAMLDRFALEALERKPERAVSDDQLVSLLHTYIMHENRHLGMIEALKGVIGLRGTATR